MESGVEANSQLNRTKIRLFIIILYYPLVLRCAASGLVGSCIVAYSAHNYNYLIIFDNSDGWSAAMIKLH